MEKKKMNTLIMLSALMNFFEQKQTLWQQNTPLAEAIQQTKTLMSEIEHLDETLSKNKTGMAIKKKSNKKSLIAVLFEMISTLSAYAAQTGDETLKEHISYPLSRLQTMRDAALVSVASAILAILTEKSMLLVNYGISDPGRNSLSNAILNYKNSLAEMRTNTTTRKRSNEKIKELLGSAMKITREQTDKLMVQYKNSNLDFYKTYLSTRKIVPYGTRYNKDDENPSPESTSPEK